MIYRVVLKHSFTSKHGYHSKNYDENVPSEMIELFKFMFAFGFQVAQIDFLMQGVIVETVNYKD